MSCKLLWAVKLFLEGEGGKFELSFWLDLKEIALLTVDTWSQNTTIFYI